MAKETETIGLYKEDDPKIKFKEWRENINSNMDKIDAGIASKQGKILGKQGQVVGFDSKGNPVPKDIADLAGKSAYQYAVEGGYTGTEAAFAELLGLTGTVADKLDRINGEAV